MYVDVPAPMLYVHLIICVFTFVKANPPLEKCGSSDGGNLALGKPAYQSTTKTADRTGKPAKADRVVDGVYNNEFYGCNSCSHTEYSSNPWWAVDLLDEYLISSVQITTPTTAGNFRGDYRISVGRSFTKSKGVLDPALCAIIRSSKPQVPGSTVTYNCPQPMVGRYVMVTLKSYGTALSLCEVAVKGEPTQTDPSKGKMNAIKDPLQVCQRSYSKIMNNQVPRINPMETAGVRSIGECAEKCSTTASCSTFAVNRDPGRILQNDINPELQCLLYECSTSLFKSQENTTLYVLNN